MPIDFNKLKKHKLYKEGTTYTPKNEENKGVLNNDNTQNIQLATVNRTNNNEIAQRVKARYENIMAQTTNTLQNSQNNSPKVNINQQMNANIGTGMRSTAKTSNVNVGKLPNTQTAEQKANQGKLPTIEDINNKKNNSPKKYEDKNTKENKKWYQKILQKPEILKDNLRHFEDGYQFGDITKTYKETKDDLVKVGAGTVADLGLGFAKGVAGIGEGVGKAISGGVAQVADWTGHDEYAKKVRNRLAGREEGAFDEKYLPTNLIDTAQKKVDKASISGEYGDKISENAGYMAGLMATETIAPGSSTATMFLNSTGNSLAEAYAKDENVEDWQAWTKAIGSGTIETVVEKSSGLLGGKGVGEKLSGKIAKQISSGVGKSLSKLLGVASDEAIEEFKSYIGNYGLDRFIDSVSKVTGSEIKFSEDWNWSEVGEAMGIAFATSFVMGGSNVQADRKSERSFARNELIDSSNLGENSKAQLKRLSEKNNWTVENLKNMLEQGGNLNSENNTANLINNSQNQAVLEGNQQITQEQNKMAQNGNMGQFEVNNQNQENTLANNQEMGYNNLQLGETKNISTKELMSLHNEGGYRTNEQIANLRESIRQNGITKPIEIYRKNDGTYGIENGNHRLQIANELEIENVPVKLVEGWENVGIHEGAPKKETINNKIGGIFEDGIGGVDRIGETNSNIDERRGSSKGSLHEINELSYNRGTAEGNVGISEGTSNGNQQTSNVENEGNSGKIKNSNESSFYLPPDETKKEQTMPLKMENEEVTLKIDLDDNVKLPEKEKIGLPKKEVSVFDEDLQAIKNASEKRLGETLTLDEQLEAIQNLNTEELDRRLPDTSTMIVDKLKKEKTTFKGFTTMIRKLVTNKGAGADDLFKATGNKQGIWKYDRYLGSFSEGQTSIGVNQVNHQGQVIGDSLLTIYDKAKKDGITQKILDDYVLNKDNIARSNYEKGLYGESITAKDSEKIIDEYDKKYPQLKDYAKQVSDFGNHNTESYLVGTFISQDLYDHMREMYPDHVPVVRDVSETPGMAEYDNVGTQVLKRAKGGDEAILSPKEALSQQSIAYAKAFRRNEALKEVYKSIQSDTKVLYDLGQIVDLEQANLEIQNAVGYDENLKKYTATIFENGEAKVFEISKDIYNAFTPSEAMTKFEDTMDKLLIGKVLKKASSGFKSLTTGKNILYALKNMVRDINDAPINSTTNFANYMKDWGYAYEQIVINGKYYKEYVNSGGLANTFYDYDKGLIKSDYSSLPKKAIDFISDLTIGNVEAINEVVETAPRLAEYIATRQRGGSIDEALYNASEVTTNFKRGGSLTKLVDKYGVPYINASVQGLSKVYRNMAEAKGFGQCAKLIVNSAIAGVLPSLLNHLIYQDDEDYEQLEDYLKDGYYLIKVDDLPKSLQNTLGRWTQNNFVRIPKGRISAVLGDTAVKIYETTQGNTDTWKGYVNDVVLNNIGINNPLTNNLFSTMTQAMNNEAWYGGSIYGETKYDGMLPAEITDEKTDKLSNWIAETLYNMVGEEKYKELVDKDNGNAFFRVLATPKLLNYVLDQYSGFVGDFVLPKLTPYAESNAFIDQFTTSSTLKSSVVSEFYEIIDNCYENSLYATDMDKLTSKYLSEVSKDVGSLYADKASIQGDNRLTDRQKQQKTYEIQEQINKKMQEAIDHVKSAKISGNTADFNGAEYYKDEEGKWKEVNEDKPDSLKTDTYADYKQKIKKATEEKKKAEGKDNVKLKDSERISIIKNSLYTDEEKDCLYTNYGTTQEDKTYSNLKLINGNDLSKIDDYLNYKVANIKGDEDTESDVKNATVKDSRKKNMINYMNNSNFDGFEKLYLYGKSYKLSSNERKQFDHFMKASNLTSEQKKKIYLDMSGVEELKDGSIRWK